MSEMSDVEQMFSKDGNAGFWNDVYGAEAPNLKGHFYRLRRDRAIEHVTDGLPPGAHVLDLGCGAGPTLLELCRRGIHCTGADYSADMLEFARKRLASEGHEDVELLQTDFRQTPFDTAAFDAVLCLGVVSYVEDYEPGLAELHRILRPGGRLVISWRNSTGHALQDPVALAKALAKFVLRRQGHSRFEPGRLLDHRIVTRQIEQAGFNLVDYEGIGVGVFRVGGKRVFGDRMGIRIDAVMTRVLDLLHLRWLRLQLADVSLWVYTRSPDPGERPADPAPTEPA